MSTIYQEINLVPYRSVAENIFMGREPRRWGFLDRAADEPTTPAAVLERLGVHIDVRRPLSTLNIALQQMVAIARAISTDARIVIMDEPTSSLDEREVEVLFDVIRGLQGAAASPSSTSVTAWTSSTPSATASRSCATAGRSTTARSPG